MNLTVKDMRAIVGFLEVAKAVTERNLRDSAEGCYHDAMTRQLDSVTALIEKIENLEI
ncbi:MAG: hypothetical protein IKZ43_04065 [Acidaminococcaceae bacterium]|nr:hypothetical protein [Acidaminococcaceae bacterium]